MPYEHVAVTDMVGACHRIDDTKGLDMKTGNKPTPPRSALGRLLPIAMETEAVKRDGWRKHGILVVDITDPRIGWIERQVLQQTGEKMYGKPDTA